MENKEILCSCGCGTRLLKYDKYGRSRSYISGHNSRKYAGEDSGVAANQRRWRHNNPDKVRDAKKALYRKHKLRAMAILGNECKFCGVRYDGRNSPIFEFHHHAPEEKVKGITRMLINNAWETVLQELAKCHLVCANCHNQHH